MPEPSDIPKPLPRAWYGDSIAEFLKNDSATIVGRLTSNCDFAVLPEQRDAWLEQIRLLKGQLDGLTGAIFLEFSIPRMGRRIDAVLLINGLIFVLEFKVGETVSDRAPLDQVWDYALDLKNFHQASHFAPIIPILIATGGLSAPATELCADEDRVYRPIQVPFDGVRPALDLALRSLEAQPLDERDWPEAPYHPTPTIIGAARALYAQHSVEAIARYDAGAQNLCVTSRRIEDLLEEARAHKRKIICFVTGVPGAGKTLVGLNVATERREIEEPTHAVFLSGNGPLVRVLHEALTRDEVARQHKAGTKVRKGKVAESIKAFIQNVHHFRDDLLSHPGAPVEHVAIFDEAQRAWNRRKTADFMQRRKKLPGFAFSEPEFLISCLDRHPDWAVIVCLVGGGQEIHVGEAGIDAWIDAVNARFPRWRMYISSRLTDSEYGAGLALDVVRRGKNVDFDDCLHLAVSMRSFRAENVSYFVKALLDCAKDDARQTYLQLVNRYPLVLTRDLRLAKQWIRDHARGTERYGLVASSKAHRLKPDAIDIRVDVDPVHWFLNDRDDTRSSYYLEDAATEFQVQGLELDWVCVAWDGDLRFSGSGWNYHAFRGDGWYRIKNLENQRYLCNAYRVLLTRARQGMVIYVPRGETADPTRVPAYYDSTYRYLAELGIAELEGHSVH
jgi:hypothetical protein